LKEIVSTETGKLQVSIHLKWDTTNSTVSMMGSEYDNKQFSHHL